MKALYDSQEPCWLCGLSWARGDAISKWLGDWVHEPCKALQQASVASEGVRTELPEARGTADTVKVWRPRIKHGGLTKLM